MISIKRILDAHRKDTAGENTLHAALQMGRLLLEGMATHVVRGRDVDVRAFSRAMKGLVRKLESPSPMDLLEVSGEALEELETYTRETTGYLQEQNEERQSMLAMLTETLADISGQTDASVDRLQAIEQQIERASGLDDMRSLRASLQSCLTALKEASAQQRSRSSATVQRLQNQIDYSQRTTREHLATNARELDIDLSPDAPENPPEVAATSFIGVFKLQRAEHIEAHFGENARRQMLSLISQTLKRVMTSNDRLVRWKGTSFVLFLHSTTSLHDVRRRLSEAVAGIGQHYIEVGKNSALISVGVDWTVFPEAQCGSMDAVIKEVDAFLSGDRPVSSVR